MAHSPSKVVSVVRTEAKCSVIVGGAGPGMKILHEIQFRMARRRGCADFFPYRGGLRSIKDPTRSTLSRAWTDQFLGYKAISIQFPTISNDSAAW